MSRPSSATRPQSRLGKLWAREGGKCAYCGRITLLSGCPSNPQRATLDHFIPKSKGGPSTWSNLLLACFACNQAKGDKAVHPSVYVNPRIPAPVATPIVLRDLVVLAKPEPPKPKPAPADRPPKAERVGAQLAAANAAISRARKEWAARHADFTREIAGLKAQLLAAEDGDARYRTHRLERALDRCRSIAAESGTVEEARERLGAFLDGLLGDRSSP